MNEDDVIAAIRDHIHAIFPRDCSCCGKRYETFADYLRDTKPIGKPVSYDAERGDWQPDRPAGTLAMANCECGTTLNVSSSGMDRDELWAVMEWARKEVATRGVALDDLLQEIRGKITRSVLGQSDDRGDD